MAFDYNYVLFIYFSKKCINLLKKGDSGLANINLILTSELDLFSNLFFDTIKLNYSQFDN